MPTAIDLPVSDVWGYPSLSPCLRQLSAGLLQLSFGWSRWCTSTAPPERGSSFGLWGSLSRPHHASSCFTTLATSSPASCFQDGGVCVEVLYGIASCYMSDMCVFCCRWWGSSASTLHGIGRPDGSTCSDVYRSVEFRDTRIDNKEQCASIAAIIRRDVAGMNWRRTSSSDGPARPSTVDQRRWDCLRRRPQMSGWTELNWKWPDLLQTKTKMFLDDHHNCLATVTSRSKVKVKDAKMLKSFSAVTPPLMVRFPSSRDHNIYLQFRGSMFAVHAMQIRQNVFLVCDWNKRLGE